MHDNQWLRDEMDALRISQREVAGVIGIDPSGVSRILSGRRQPTPGEKELLRVHFAKVREEMDRRGSIPADLSPLGRAMLIAGMPVHELSHRSGVSVADIDAYRDRGQYIPFEHVRWLAKALGIPEYQLSAPGPEREKPVLPRRSAAKSGSVPPIAQPRGTVPVYAPPVADGTRLLCDFEMLELRRPPPELDGVARAYGMYIGDGDYPCRYRRGDIAWVRSGRPVLAGEETLAVLDRQVWLGRLDETGPAGHVVRIGDRTERLDAHAELHRIVAVSFG